MKLEFKIFRATFASWETLCKEVAEFVTAIGRNDIETISQSADHHEGIVTVWYWVNKRR